MTDAAWSQQSAPATTASSSCAAGRRWPTSPTALSNTYLAGEKSINPDHYDDGTPPNDDQGWDTGFRLGHRAMERSDDYAGRPRRRRRTSTTSRHKTCRAYVAGNFGSAHAVSFNMAFCDGSVHAINYSIDLETLHRLGTRAEGKAIDGKQL